MHGRETRLIIEGDDEEHEEDGDHDGDDEDDEDLWIGASIHSVSFGYIESTGSFGKIRFGSTGSIGFGDKNIQMSKFL